jgi:APA family basic amino acid/polyamine antiporter
MAKMEKPQDKEGLIRSLTLFSATAIVVGSMIGSGIFIAPSIMAGYVQSAGVVTLLWVVGGIFTLFGALSYGELAASIPKSGGQYVFLKEAYSPLWGFLYGWTLFLVIQTGFIAAVAVAFAKYLGVFIPGLSENVILFKIPLGAHAFTFNSAQAVGIVSIIVLVIINCFGIKLGAAVQNIFTFLKVIAIVLLVLLGFAIGKGSFSHFVPLLKPVLPATLNISLFAALAVALSKALFAYDAWNSVTFTAEEVKNPHRNLPLSLGLGTILVTLLYTSATAVYFYLVPAGQAASVPDNRIAAVAAQVIFGGIGLYFISAAILVSTFGCNNGLILSGPRVYYAMAKDRIFFKGLAAIHPKYKTPVNAIVFQGAWACILTLTGTFSDLLTYSAFASVLFNVMTVIGIYILRKKQPELPRPYKAFGYPVVPAIYILIAVAFVIFILQGDLLNSLKGLVLIVIGIPVYFWFQSRKRKSERI